MHAQRAEIATPPDVTHGMGVVRPFLISFATTLVFTAIVLASAGRLTVWQAWVYAGLSLALNVAQRLILMSNPELARERAAPGEGGRPADKALLGLGLLLTLAMLVTAGLQLRYVGGPSLAISWFVLLSVIVLIVRTQLEDALLTKELDGYGAYREQTRFRLIPGLW